MTTPLPCPRCGRPAQVHFEPQSIPNRDFEWYVTCEAYESDDLDTGHGPTREEAIESWNDQVESYLDDEERELPYATFTITDRQNANAPQVGLGGVQGAGSQADATCDRRHTQDSRGVTIREKKPVDN